MDTDFSNLLKKLLERPRITKKLLNEAPKQQGAYILWLDMNPALCLKVGIAGPRRGEGLQGRLRLHFLSHLSNTVLARHMQADIEFGTTQGYDFYDRRQRQEFLAEKCLFQTIPLPSLNKTELRRFENFIEAQLKPKYKGRIKQVTKPTTH